MELNNSKAKNIFENIKSKYILQHIFKHLNEATFLKIIKHNKYLHNNLEITIDNYINHSKIEIELELYPDKKYGHFINLYDKNPDYFHIYLNNSTEEITNKYDLSTNGNIQQIKIVIDYEQISFNSLFQFCGCIKKIKFVKFYRKNIIDMSSLFCKCYSLQEINFSQFNTENVTNMSNMFIGCSELKQLDLSHFNTQNVTDMSYMFNFCSSLEKLNLSKKSSKYVFNVLWM